MGHGLQIQDGLLVGIARSGRAEDFDGVFVIRHQLDSLRKQLQRQEQARLLLPSRKAVIRARMS